MALAAAAAAAAAAEDSAAAVAAADDDVPVRQVEVQSSGTGIVDYIPHTDMTLIDRKTEMTPWVVLDGVVHLHCWGQLMSPVMAHVLAEVLEVAVAEVLEVAQARTSDLVLLVGLVEDAGEQGEMAWCVVVEA